MRLSTVILPTRRWTEGGGRRWLRAEELGFHAAPTPTTTWRAQPAGPDPVRRRAHAIAAAAATRSIRLGTSSLRPTSVIRAVREGTASLDDLSGGRVTPGLGAGANGFDATALGQAPGLHAGTRLAFRGVHRAAGPAPEGARRPRTMAPTAPTRRATCPAAPASEILPFAMWPPPGPGA
ncbi:LLM class flavin-dependent oxidoreductase [Streptomyces tricolor]|nr:LLM class flavin-dependent oxidoreductase [Streptomyces tricolor]